MARASRPCEGGAGVVGTFPEAMPPYEGGGAGVRRKGSIGLPGTRALTRARASLAAEAFPRMFARLLRGA